MIWRSSGGRRGLRSFRQRPHPAVGSQQLVGLKRPQQFGEKERVAVRVACQVVNQPPLVGGCQAIAPGDRLLDSITIETTQIEPLSVSFANQ